MRAHEPGRPTTGRRIRLRPLGATACAALLLGGCTGENLFTGIGGANQLSGPSVDITAPQAGLVVATGDSVQVVATVSGPDGVREVALTGLFQAGGVAFVAEILALDNPTDTTITEFLTQAAGAGDGNVDIVVEATDVLGERGADTVSVMIN